MISIETKQNSYACLFKSLPYSNIKLIIMRRPNILKQPERSVLTAALAIGIGMVAITAPEASTQANSSYPAVIKTIGESVRGTITDSLGSASFNYEEVMYMSDGSREVLNNYTSQPDNHMFTVGDFGEACQLNINSSKPGHGFLVANLITHTGIIFPGSKYCNSEKLTPATFAANPFTLGVPGYIDQK